MTWKKELVQNNPDLFVEDFWGFEVPPTWQYAMEKLIERTRWDVEKNKAEGKFTQIKEKFGGLRAYYIITTDKERADELWADNVAYCEAIVDHTCELCGAMGVWKMTKGWLRRVCKTCAPTLYEENENDML